MEIFHARSEWLFEGKLPMFKGEQEREFEKRIDAVGAATSAVASLELPQSYKAAAQQIMFAIESGATDLIRAALDGFATGTQADLILVPRYDAKGSSGPGALVEADRIVDHIAFSQEFIRDVVRVPPKHLAIIEVTGQSMEPTLSSGEYVMVDLRRDRFIDDAVYVIQQDGNLRIKRVQMRLDGTVLVKSDNTFYDDEVLTKEIAESLRVIGTVLPFKFGRFKL